MELISDTGERLLIHPRRQNAKHGSYWSHLSRYVHANRSITRHDRRARILDAACGGGYGTYLLSHHHGQCIGVDNDPQAIAFCKSGFAQPNLRYLQANVVELPFRSETFDVVVSFETIEHLGRSDQARFVAEIKRVLRPGGTLIISAPVIEGGREKPADNPFHLYEPDPAEFVDLVTGHFPTVGVFGQLLGPKGTGSAATTPQAAGPVTRRGLWRRASSCPKSVLRSGANALCERYYLRSPRLLGAITRWLYAGNCVKPLDLSRQTAACVVLNAVKSHRLPRDLQPRSTRRRPGRQVLRPETPTNARLLPGA